MWFQQSLLRYYHLTLIIYYLEEFEQHLDFNNESRQTQYKDWENKNLKNERRVLINHKEIEVTSFDSSDDEVVSPNILNVTTMIPKLDQTKSSFNNRNKSFDNRTGNERSEYLNKRLCQRPSTTLNARRFTGYHSITSTVELFVQSPI